MDDVILKGYIQIKCSNPGRLKRKVRFVLFQIFNINVPPCRLNIIQIEKHQSNLCFPSPPTSNILLGRFEVFLPTDFKYPRAVLLWKFQRFISSFVTPLIVSTWRVFKNLQIYGSKSISRLYKEVNYISVRLAKYFWCIDSEVFLLASAMQHQVLQV